MSTAREKFRDFDDRATERVSSPKRKSPVLVCVGIAGEYLPFCHGSEALFGNIRRLF